MEKKIKRIFSALIIAVLLVCVFYSPITNYDKLVAAETALNNLLNPDNSQNQGGNGNENTEENTLPVAER